MDREEKCMTEMNLLMPMFIFSERRDKAESKS